MRRCLSLILLLAVAGCVTAMRRRPLEKVLEGRCFTYVRRSFSRGSAAAPRPGIVRLTGRIGVLPGAPVTWRVVEPEIGRRYTLWRAVSADSVWLIWSISPTEQVTLRLVAVDSGLVGTERLESDIGSDQLDVEPPPERQVFLRSAACASGGEGAR